jgi:polyhydroxybutyrate depolymerase
MRVDNLGMIVSFFIAVGTAGCGNDSPPGPGPTPTPDSGDMDTGPSPDDGGADAPSGDMRPCTGSTLTEGTSMLTYKGITYSYIVHMPPSYDGTKRTPLLFNWHGSNSDGIQQQLYTDANALANTEGFIVVNPSSPDRTWAAGTCCSMFIDGGNPDRDDIGFARALAGEISGKACIDEKRIYTMGLSNGGFLSHALACTSSDLFAAAVSVAGQMGIPNCQPSRAMPIMEFHGTADMTISYDMPGLSAEGVGVPEMMKNWSTRDGCTKGPDVTFQKGVVTCQTWSGCQGGALVTLCTEEGVEHCWPGAAFCPGGKTNTSDISATKDGWAFLKQFVLP